MERRDECEKSKGMATAREIDPFLKADLPTRAPKHHRQSLPRRALGFPPYDTGARSHISCNRRTGYYVQRNRTATCANVASSRDYRTSATTQGSLAHDPIVPIKCDGHGSVSRGNRHDSWYDHRQTDSNCSNRRTEAVVQPPTRPWSHL
jgi:hypothetical protein